MSAFQRPDPSLTAPLTATAVVRGGRWCSLVDQGSGGHCSQLLGATRGTTVGVAVPALIAKDVKDLGRQPACRRSPRRWDRRAQDPDTFQLPQQVGGPLVRDGQAGSDHW